MIRNWEGSALFSDEDPPLFRWRLDRWWGSGPRALVCMANPSYAGGDKNDPTITQLIKLTEALGFPGFTAVNWSPYIATAPKALHAWRWNHPEQAVPAENRNIAQMAALSADAAVRIIAWGNIVPSVPVTQRVLRAMSLDHEFPLFAFGTTKDGAPKHPMARGKARLAIGAPLVVWPEDREAA